MVDKESGQIYYWNEHTSKSPASQCVRQAEHQFHMRTWLLLAYRCRRLCSDHALMLADETTALGEPKPGPEGRRLMQQQAVVGRSTSLLGLVGVGAGIGLTFAIIGRLLG